MRSKMKEFKLKNNLIVVTNTTSSETEYTKLELEEMKARLESKIQSDTAHLADIDLMLLEYTK